MSEPAWLVWTVGAVMFILVPGVPIALYVWLRRGRRAATLRRLFGKLLCQAGRHKPVTVLTDVRIEEVSLFGVHGRALASELRCRRCSNRLDERTPHG